MGKHDSGDCCINRIEAGQILNPDCFPTPNELVCIQVPKVFDQVALRNCQTRTIPLTCGVEESYPKYTFQGASNFDIVDVKVISKTDSMTRPGFKKLVLSVKVCYVISYSDGYKDMKIRDEVTFPLTVNEIYCPSCLTQIGVIRFPKEHHGKTHMVDEDGSMIKVEALIEAFNEAISGNTLTIDIGGFFIVKCECVVQLLMPAYGYCPVPPEQVNPASLTCTIFNDRCKTPFPTKFFPDQKWNPLDKTKKEDWDD